VSYVDPPLVVVNQRSSRKAVIGAFAIEPKEVVIVVVRPVVVVVVESSPRRRQTHHSWWWIRGPRGRLAWTTAWRAMRRRMTSGGGRPAQTPPRWAPPPASSSVDAATMGTFSSRHKQSTRLTRYQNEAGTGPGRT
jgi:hypothetical protein